MVRSQFKFGSADCGEIVKSEALVQELKSKVPGVAYMPQTGTPAHTEVDDPAPAYDLPGKGGYAARLVPGDGLWLTLRECLD